MKKIIAALALALTVGGSWWAYNYLSKSTECLSCKREVTERDLVKQPPQYSAAGQKLFWTKIRHNEITGELPLDAVLQARIDAKHYAADGYRGALNLQWEEMGPDNQGGRSRAILIDKDNPNKMYAGGVSGGLWVSTNSGASWDRVPGSDGFDNHIVSAIAQADNGNIYFGTGEYFPVIVSGTGVTGAGGFIGNGLWASTDGGASWTNIKEPAAGNSNTDPWAFVLDMKKDGQDGNKIWVGVRGQSQKSLYSIDANTNDVTVTSAALQVGPVHDIECGSDGSVHISLGNPGSAAKYYRKKAGETAFTNIVIPNGTNLNRLQIAISPSNPNSIFFAGSYSANGDYLKGVWHSTDGGDAFEQIAGQESATTAFNWQPMRGQGVYDMSLAVHPTNPDMLFLGGIDLYRYTPDEGFNKISNWEYSIFSPNYVHADQHNLAFRQDNPNVMYAVNDGGVYRTGNNTASTVVWATKNTNYITTQFYSVFAKNYTGELLGGTQDNGNWLIDFQGNTTRWGVKIKSGDGGDVAVSTINPNIIFAEYVAGDLARSSNNGASFSNMLDCNIDFAPANASGSCGGDNMPDEGSPFISQFELWENQYDPNQLTQSKFFLGTQNRVWMTQEALDLTKTPTWFRITKSPLAGAVSAIEATKDGQTLFVGTESGALYRITGLNQVLSYSTVGSSQVFNPDSFDIQVDLIEAFSSRYITGIDINESDYNDVVVTLGNYGSSTTSYVKRSSNAMAAGTTPTFAGIDGSGLPKMPVYCVLIDPQDADNLIIGTELGVYSSNNGGSSWTIEETMPRVPVMKMHRHLYNDPVTGETKANTIVAGTYGRGIWRTRTMEYTGVHDVAIASKSLGLFPNPANAQSSLKINLVAKTDLTVTVYGMNGQQVKQYTYKNQVPGVKTYDVQTADLANGTYLVRVQGQSFNATEKLVVLR